MSEEVWHCDQVVTYADLFSREECQRYIELSEEMGYEPAAVSSPHGDVVVQDYRNNDRLIYESAELSSTFWEHIEDLVPYEHDGSRVVGLNPRFRFYRYHPGQSFEWHVDHPVSLDGGEFSHWTVMLYLNENFEGGETTFEDSYSPDTFEQFSVKPCQGTVLMFEHEILHRGEKVTTGCKYVLRTDLMYLSNEYETDEEDSWDSHDDDEPSSWN